MAALKALFDKKQLALTRARLRAWWDGEELDEAGVLAQLEAEAANDAEAPIEGADDALFDYDLPPRLAALGVMWGEGRIRPGDASADILGLGQIAVPADGVLAVLGAGLIAPVEAIAARHPGRIDVFEWREETLDALKHAVSTGALQERVQVARIDLESHVFQPNHYAGLISVDDFAYCGHGPRLAQQIMKCLRPGAAASVESYMGFKCGELATAFASSFAEPQIRPHGDVLQYLTDSGLALEGDEDVSEAFLAMARGSFLQLGEKLAEAAKLDVATARELAWEAEAWKMRLRLLAQRRLERRRLLLRKPNDAPSDVVEEVASPIPAAADAPESEKSKS
ncbi:MAG: hypothetical protein J0L81_17965 [Caulobacterales bacterium]|jgi:hypothetical protein|nr:hypothetical protein [Caulobacterales bacterium]